MSCVCVSVGYGSFNLCVANACVHVNLCACVHKEQFEKSNLYLLMHANGSDIPSCENTVSICAGVGATIFMCMPIIIS